MSLLEISDLTHAFGDHTLYEHADFSLYKGEHVGIVGQNGAGKSTFMQICTGQLVPDAGMVTWQSQAAVGYLDQYADVAGDPTILEFLHTAFQSLYELEEKMTALYQDSLENPDAFTQAAECQSILEANDFYSIDVRIQQVTEGLGLTAIGVERQLSQLSGGQRAKAILAKLLLQDPDVLLLDEPTNFLDKEHIQWLADFLSSCPKAFLVISHDHQFLGQISTAICDIDEHTIRKYSGTYADFLKQKQHLREDYIRRYRTQQREIQKTEAYIRKNIAGVNSKNAKGRRKQLAHIDRLAAPELTTIKPTFHFQAVPAAAQEVLKLSHLSVGYDFPVLSDLSFTVQNGERLVVTGFNGIGKSTLLKTLVGRLPSLSGSFRFAETAVPTYYSQDLFWEEENQTPVEIFSSTYPDYRDKEVRRQLSHAGISVQHAMQPVGTLSGGEQAKLKLCLLLQRPCNFLLLDEPTNHLDVLAKEALKEALMNFTGTVLLVSHEESFYRGWADRILNIETMR